MSNQIDLSMKILKTAIAVEDNGLMTFLKFARQTNDLTGKNMFIRLAMDENQHRQILEKQLEKVFESGTWEKVEVPTSEIERISPLIREKHQRTKGESGLAEVEALKTALDLERKAASYFREQSNLVNDPEAKALFQRLAEWEDAHYDLIQAELDSIYGTGFWFDIPEFRMDGKY